MKNNSNSTVGLVNGSMAVAKKAARVKPVTRRREFISKLADRSESIAVGSASISPYPLGTQVTSDTLLYSASRLSDNALEWIQKHDKYRIAEVEVFVTLTSKSKNGAVDRTAPVEVYFYEDTDADPGTQTSWIRVMDRSNLGRVVLNAYMPSQRLISFKPTITYAAGAIDQNPANIVPKKDVWLDALATQQLYSGLRVFSCCAQQDSNPASPSYDYTLSFQTRYHVEASQPL